MCMAVPFEYGDPCVISFNRLTVTVHDERIIVWRGREHVQLPVVDL